MNCNDGIFSIFEHARPYVIINKIHRKYLDLNRDKTANHGQGAFEDSNAEKYYDFYHQTVSVCCVLFFWVFLNHSLQIRSFWLLHIRKSVLETS